MRKYYKWESWTQPIMTSNNQDGLTLSCANMSSSNIYILFNGVSNSDYITPTSTTAYTCYVNIAFDFPIKLSNIRINSYTKVNVTYDFKDCKIIGTTLTGEEITISTTTIPDTQAWANTDFPVDNLVIRNLRIYATSKGSPHPRIGEITLTAQKVVESTEQDYDFYRDIDIYKLPCRKYVKRFYYDYTKPWEQPVCSSNTSHGTFTGGGYFSEGSGDRAYYHVSDNSWPTSPIGGGWDGTCWGTTHSASGWFNWELPETIRITGIKVMARNYSQSSTDYVVSNARFYTASDKVTPIGDTFNLTTCGQQLDIVNIPEDGILTNNIYFYKGGGGEYSGFAEIWITAYTLQKISASEYEQGTAFAYYIDANNTYDTKGFKYKDGLKYYKYTYNTWNQPILSDYTNGTFKVSASSETQASTNPYRAWEAFDNNSSTYWRSGTTSGWIMFENKNPLNVTSLTWGYFYNYPTGGNVEVSNDGINFMEIQTWTNNSGADFTINLSNNTGYYKYYRININGVNTDVIHLKQLGITATEKLSVETDETDYEFTEPYYRNYYKTYIDTNTIAIPNYTSLIAATDGINGIKIIDNPNTYAIFGHTNWGSYYEFYADTATTVLDLGYECNLVDFSYNRYEASGYSYSAGLLSIEASIDNQNWTTLYSGSYQSTNIDTTNYSDSITFYRYLKVTFKHYPAQVGSQRATVSYFNTRIKNRKLVRKATATDYDFYKDIIGYRYKALKL